MKTVILDGYTINPGDLSWSALEALSQVKVCDRTPAEQLAETIGDAEAIFTSKNKITECTGKRHKRGEGKLVHERIK